MRGRVLTRGSAVVLLLFPATAAPVHAQSAPTPSVVEDYAADGRISACAHSAEALRRARAGVAPDVEQYAAGYPEALQSAIEARARGECSGTAAAAATPTPTPVPTPVTDASGTVLAEPPAPPAAGAPAAGPAPDGALDRAVAAAPGNDVPLPVVLLGVVAALVAVCALVAVAVRRSGVTEGGFGRAGDAWREATWRAGGTWADFRDWLRLGR